MHSAFRPNNPLANSVLGFHIYVIGEPNLRRRKLLLYTPSPRRPSTHKYSLKSKNELEFIYQQNSIERKILFCWNQHSLGLWTNYGRTKKRMRNKHSLMKNWFFFLLSFPFEVSLIIIECVPETTTLYDTYISQLQQVLLKKAFYRQKYMR